MDKQQITYFKELTTNRMRAATELEGFALCGVKNSVVEKYSDQAHFIYELLQNANDAKATSARFELSEDKLVFIHNGTRRFFVSNPATEKEDLERGILGDINAITAVGGSNKTDENTIGKFGVGFKAVFQYTTTPRIYDPNVFFKIERFIVPIQLETDYPYRENEETLFVFPFDHDNRSAEDAYSDISEKLRSLDYPLLFLSNLKDISFEISKIPGSYGKSIVEDRDFNGTIGELIQLTQNYGENGNDPHDNMLWLFSRNHEKNYTYSVGYFVDKDGYLIPKTHSAFCFFTTKEVTGLNFIIHAPFLLTDSREGIRAGVEHNINMISLLSELAADSLVYLRDIGLSNSIPLINDNIFDIVPYDENSFGDVNSKNVISFKPFYTAIKESFKNNDIILSQNNVYVSSANAYWGGVDNKQLAEVFLNEQLAYLTKNNDAKWAFVSLSTPRISGRDIKSDYIKSFVKNSMTDYSIINLINKSFIESQKIDWLNRLYKYISVNNDRIKQIRTKPIFLDSKNEAVAAYDTKNQLILFLPKEDCNEYTTVNETLLQNEDTLKLIKQLDIQEPSTQDEIYNIILPQYKDGASICTKPHFKKFFEYYLSCPQTSVKSFLGLLREQKFILYKSKNNKEQYRGEPSILYLPSESLNLWFDSKPTTVFVCLDEYLKLLGNDKEEELVRFLIDLGVKDYPRILSQNLSEHEAYEIKPPEQWKKPASYNMHTREWSEQFIDGCQENIKIIVKNQNKTLSVAVWKQLLELVKYGPSSFLFGKYKYFYQYYRVESFESSEAKRLCTMPWLLNSDGKFVSPSELTINTLNPKYDMSSDEALQLISILGIKEDIDNTDIITYAESLGLSEEEQRLALLEYAKNKNNTADTKNLRNNDLFDDENSIDISSINPSIKRVAKEILNRASSTPKEHPAKQEDVYNNIPTDEDDYTKPIIDISKKIEKVKEQAEHKIQEIAKLEDLYRQAQQVHIYSYGWFKTLLELESMNSEENNSNSREISISFAKVEHEVGTSRILVLKHPNRYIPQSIEDLADIPLELHFSGQPMIKVAVEVVNVKSYSLRAKLRTNAQIDDVDLSLVTEARIEAKNPVFLIEELRKAFIRLGNDNRYNDDFDMQSNLCENIEFVFGPPGTGKTTHVAKDIIIPMMKCSENLKVLVLTPTNKSADVLVRRLMESTNTNKSYKNWLVRFGTTDDVTIEKDGVFRDKTFDIRTFPRNVTVTTIARFPYDYFLPDDATRLHISALKWDYIIIDEASMISLANIIYPLYKKTPKKFIIAGDPFQIEPITTIDIWKNENIYTMVKLKSFTKPTTIPHQYHVKLLTTQYRSIPEIGEIFSHFAYGGVLKHFRTSKSQRQLPINDFIDIKPLNIIKFPVSKFESIYRPKRLQTKTPYQVYSALFSFEFVKYLSSLIEQVKGNDEFHIGLIAPYRAQADLIDKLLTSVTLPKNVNIQVGTIHGFQGDECDIIIALFNPPPSISSHKEMFLNKLNIVNVSISRARDYLFIIMPNDETEDVKNLKLIKEVERLCKKQTTCSEQLSPAIENIMFGSKTYIEDNSFSTSHQLVNVYGKPEKLYEIRSEDNAVDIQIHD